MKKVVLFSVIALAFTACSNPQAEAQEEKTRDSAISVQKSEDEKLVEEMMKADSIKEANAAKGDTTQAAH